MGWGINIYMKEKMRSLIKWVKHNLWYMILLAWTTCFVAKNNKIILGLQFKELGTVHIMFLLWIILLVLPLFSEMDLFGIKLKKEVYKATEEVKEKIMDLKLQLIQSQQLSNSIAIDLGNQWLPTEKKMKILKENIQKKAEENPHFTVENQKMSRGNEKDFLYIRLIIEKYITELMDKMGCSERIPLSEALKILFKSDILDAVIYDLINQVLKIADRRVHGEIVSEEYINFVAEAFPQIEANLKQINNEFIYMVCPRCKYSGYSKYENVCPKCGYINDCD